MPMPLWWGHVNKRVFNPRALQSRRWKVINHVGRKSGKRYRTPLDVWDTGDTLVFVLVYGSRSDWVQNILAAGTATLDGGEESVELDRPRIIDAESARRVIGTGGPKLPPAFLKIDEYLQMDVVARRAVEAGSVGR